MGMAIVMMSASRSYLAGLHTNHGYAAQHRTTLLRYRHYE